MWEYYANITMKIHIILGTYLLVYSFYIIFNFIEECKLKFNIYFKFYLLCIFLMAVLPSEDYAKRQACIIENVKSFCRD
jgi:hypothetical protein